MKLRPSLLATIAAVCIAAGAARAQYVEDSIDVGHAWVGSLAYNSREDVIYGASESGVFFAISCDSNELVKSLPLGGAFAVAYDSSDNKAYCTFGDSLLAVDGVTHARIKSLPMDGANTPVWDPVSNRLYVSCQSTNKVAVVDCATDSLLTYMSVGASPTKMYINTLRRKLYVLNYDNGTVTIVNMTTDQVIRNLFVGGTPNAGYYSRSVDKFYSAGTYGQCIVIDGAADSVVARIALPGTSADIVSATGNEDAALVYLGINDWPVSYVATVSAHGGSLLDTTNVGLAPPYGLAYYGRSGLLYCAPGGGDSQVAVISNDGSRVLTLLQVGDGPFVFAQVPGHNRLYVGHLNSRYVYVLRDTSAGITEVQSRLPGFSRFLSATPNPFSQSVTVAWNTAVKGGNAVRVYAQDGRVVRQARIPAGHNTWVWDGRDDSGAPLPPGVYVIEAGPGLRAKVVKME